MPENFFIHSSFSFDQLLQPASPKADDPPSVPASSSQGDNLNPEDEAEANRNMARLQRHRLMRGMASPESHQAGNRAALSQPAQTQEGLEQMLNELAASREITTEELYSSIFTSDNRQYTSLYEPGFTVYRFPVENKQSIVLAREEDGQFKEVRPARPLDYLLASLPNLRALLRQVQEEGVSFEIVNTGPLGRCYRQNKVILINDAISPYSIDTKEKKAVLLAIAVAHEIGHYINGDPTRENVDKYVDAWEYSEGYATLEQLKVTSENPQFTTFMRNVIKRALVSGEKLLQIYDEFEERNKNISEENDEAKEDLEIEICRRLGNVTANEIDENGLIKREKWRMEY